MSENVLGGGVGLSPPDVQYYNEVKYSVGDDHQVKVGPYFQEPNGPTIITLHVKGLKKAQALATLLVNSLSIGNFNIEVRVLYKGQLVLPFIGVLTPFEIVKLYQIAFKTNRLYKTTKARDIFDNVFVYPIFKAEVVQFFNDDISDYYSNYNNVAAFVFRTVLKNEISGTIIQFSTAKKKK
ncbi:hypothetical protein ACFQZE_23370 [Paenibacillus sp. GCM10027627]|uniref:hypothetical protein n=1 Tax=unclassified Paenibacillus TaxID=185978 RepID=UPI003633D67A